MIKGDRNNFNFQLKRLRIDRELKASYLSKRLYIDQSLLSKFESGSRKLDNDALDNLMTFLEFESIEVNDYDFKSAYKSFNNLITAYLKWQKYIFNYNINYLKKEHKWFFEYNSSTYFHSLIIELFGILINRETLTLSKIRLFKFVDDNLTTLNQSTLLISIVALSDYFLKVDDYDSINRINTFCTNKYKDTSLLLYYMTNVDLQKNVKYFNHSFPLALSKSMEKMHISRSINLTFLKSLSVLASKKNYKNITYLIDYTKDITVDFEMVDFLNASLQFLKVNSLVSADKLEIPTELEFINSDFISFKKRRKEYKIPVYNISELQLHMKVFYNCKFEKNLDNYLNTLIKLKSFFKIEFLDSFLGIVEFFDIEDTIELSKIKFKNE